MDGIWKGDPTSTIPGRCGDCRARVAGTATLLLQASSEATRLAPCHPPPMVTAGPHASSYAKTFAVTLRALARRSPTGGGSESRPAGAAVQPPPASDPA